MYLNSACLRKHFNLEYLTFPSGNYAQNESLLLISAHLQEDEVATVHQGHRAEDLTVLSMWQGRDTERGREWVTLRPRRPGCAGFGAGSGVT